MLIMIKKLATKSISSLVITGMIIIAVVPITFLSIHLYESAWKNSWREIEEKHKLLAQNLAAPIQIFVNDHKNYLNLLANSIGDTPPATTIQSLFTKNLAHLTGFVSLTYLDAHGIIRAHARRGEHATHIGENLSQEM